MLDYTCYLTLLEKVAKRAKEDPESHDVDKFKNACDTCTRYAGSVVTNALDRKLAQTASPDISGQLIEAATGAIRNFNELCRQYQVDGLVFTGNICNPADVESFCCELMTEIFQNRRL